MEKLGLHKGGAGEGVEEVPFGASKTLGHLGHNISRTLFSVMTTLPMDARDQCSPPLRCLSHTFSLEAFTIIHILWSNTSLALRG